MTSGWRLILREGATRIRWGAVAAVLVTAATASAADPCQVAEEQSGLTIPVERLNPAARCLIGPVVNGYTTSGVIGPVLMPIGQGLYEYLIDRPVITAWLVRRLGLGAYEFSERPPSRFWVNDGDGTQGLLTVVYQDEATRIYHVDGYHEGHVFPMVRGQAVVFLRLEPRAAPDGHATVQTSLVAYTRLNDPVLDALVSILRPLVGEAVTRKLTHGFAVTTQLAGLIAHDPARVVQEVASLTDIESHEQQTLIALLRAVAQGPLPLQPSPSTP